MKSLRIKIWLVAVMLLSMHAFGASVVLDTFDTPADWVVEDYWDVSSGVYPTGEAYFESGAVRIVKPAYGSHATYVDLGWYTGIIRTLSSAQDWSGYEKITVQVHGLAANVLDVNSDINLILRNGGGNVADLRPDAAVDTVLTGETWETVTFTLNSASLTAVDEIFIRIDGSLGFTAYFDDLTLVEPAPAAVKVLEYKFDETTGTTANDTAGTNHGTLSGFPTDDSQWVAGTEDGALSFGAADQVSIPAGVTGNSSYSLSFFIKGAAGSNQYQNPLN